MADSRGSERRDPHAEPSAVVTAAAACPGCGATLPPRPDVAYDGDFNASPACWSVFTDVLGAEFGNVWLFGQVHQLTVDAFAVQHAGGRQRDKSVVVHLVGLHLVLAQGKRAVDVPPLLQRLAAAIRDWPHWDPPQARGRLTVHDVAAAPAPQDHARLARAWAGDVWDAWRGHHRAVAQLVERHL